MVQQLSMATKKKAKKTAETASPPPEVEPEEEADEEAQASAQEPEEPYEETAEDLAKQQRVLLKRGSKAVEALTEVFEALEVTEEVNASLELMQQVLKRFEPPPPRKCKEYKRALALARKGMAGIHPDDVMKYCRCEECHLLREDQSVEHPRPLGGATL